MDPDVNSVPLRLDDGTGTQGVTNIVSGVDPFATSPTQIISSFSVEIGSRIIFSRSNLLIPKG